MKRFLRIFLCLGTILSLLLSCPPPAGAAEAGNTLLLLQVGNGSASRNGAVCSVPAPAYADNGALLVPLRAAAEAMGCRVSWEPASRQAVVSHGETVLQIPVGSWSFRAGGTAVSQVQLIDGERVFGDYDEGVMAQFALTPGDVEFLCSYDLVVSGLWGRVEKSLAQIAARGVPVAFDCSERPEDEAAQIALPHTTLAFFSDDASDLERLKERILAVATLGPRVVVATRGEKGSVAFEGTAFHTQGVLPCVVKDTMGAGDSYIAGFLMEYLRGKDLPACMAAGAASSAVTLGYVGAW